MGRARLRQRITDQPPRSIPDAMWDELFDAMLSDRDRALLEFFVSSGAALLGYLNIQTTRGYVAVFDEDVVRHYQAHLQHRRKIRPSEEYAPVTAEEWTEFEEHFDKRKVELGSCARPYGTGRQHEHACIRGPMLNVNPKMINRLGELEQDLLARRIRAEAENWLGEIEGINLTLSFLRSKRDQAERQAQRPLIHLGLPQPRGRPATDEPTTPHPPFTQPGRQRLPRQRVGRPSRATTIGLQQHRQPA
ncbi:phage integrase [Micromonospora sp. ATCC 39149]|uniref:hypothetical protein n=1 Tax=Micromonospora sp. (strain ATCC 39149 / NRRL 15099 / SCC 1413) TaxID=219305 RepID=UPI0001A50941|nr:hypothetical protein [Micromonospora sp. ATCC 39149]EEP75300.1 phage integrase [Micromonospora sp. ATCC 39149]